MFIYVEQSDIECIVDAVDKCSGEATVNNRKGKLIFFYEWELVLKWSGCLLNNSKLSHKGKLTIPNLSEENSLEDVFDEATDVTDAAFWAAFLALLASWERALSSPSALFFGNIKFLEYSSFSSLM